MKNLNVGVFHTHREPITSGAEPKTEDLAAKVMLLKLSSFPEIPRPDSVVQTSSPEFSSISRDINTAGTISVSLELSDKSLVVQIPDCNVSIAATTETHFRVGTDGQGVAGGGAAGQLRLDTRIGGGQVPDGQGARLSSNHQSSSIGKKFNAANVVISCQTIQLRHRSLAARLTDVPHLDTPLAPGVHILGGVGHGHGADHITMRQTVDLTNVPRYSRANQGIWGEGNRPGLSIRIDMERISSEIQIILALISKISHNL